MLTETQAAAVARYLVAHTPGASSGYLDHGYETAWEFACDALGALGYATEAPRGARLLPSPIAPAVLPRWDDTCCVVLSVAEQLCQLRLRHSWSEPDEETGPGTADPETAEVLNILEITSSGAWVGAATPVLWRTAPEEVRPPTEQEFSAQVDLAVADIPDDVRDRIHSIYSEHRESTLRDHLQDWVFYEAWRWGDGWVTGEHGGRTLGVFHDPLAQRVRGAVVARVMGA
jgi:hypothetical protein